MKTTVRRSLSFAKVGQTVRFDVLCILVLIAFAWGCSSHPKRRGVTLGEAAAEAEKKPEDQEVLKPKKKTPKEGHVRDDDDDYEEYHEYDTGVVVVDGVEPPGATQPRPIEKNAQPKPWHLGLVFGGGSLTGEEIDGFGVGGIQGGIFTPDHRWRFDVRGLVIPTNLTDASGLSGGLKDEVEFAFDIAGRGYLTPAHTLMGLYGTAGIRLGILTWLYENPIEVDIGGGLVERIQSDDLKYFSIYVGIGTSLLQTRHLHLGGNLTGGFKFYQGVTGEGFDNNVLDDEAFGQLMFELTFIFN